MPRVGILVQETWARSTNETIHALVLFFPFQYSRPPVSFFSLILLVICRNGFLTPTGGGPMSVKKRDQLPANDPPISCKFDSRAPHGADTTDRRNIGNV